MVFGGRTQYPARGVEDDAAHIEAKNKEPICKKLQSEVSTTELEMEDQRAVVVKRNVDIDDEDEETTDDGQKILEFNIYLPSIK